MVSQRVKTLNIAALVLIIFVVGLGAFTRLVDAGLGCPDWPGCYGHLTWPVEASDIARAEAVYPDTPVDHDKTWPEMVHRYFAGALLVLVLAIAVSIWRDPPSSGIKALASVLLGLIICQAAFGAWTVTLKLWPQVVTAHLLGGFTTFSLLWVMFLRQSGAPQLQLLAADKRALKPHAVLALIVVALQIALGGWVSSNYAALACADFPTCFGTYAPSMDVAHGFNLFQSVGPNYLGGLMESEGRVAIHWFHRLGALVVLAVVLPLALRLWKYNRVLGLLLLTVLTLQLVLGVLNVVWNLPLAVATAHNGVGALLLLAVVTVNFAPAAQEMHRRSNEPLSR